MWEFAVLNYPTIGKEYLSSFLKLGDFKIHNGMNLEMQPYLMQNNIIYYGKSGKFGCGHCRLAGAKKSN
jgi:hypothetical protein